MFLSIALVSFVSLSFLAVTALLQIQLGNFKDYWYERAQVVVYLCNEAANEAQCPSGIISEAQLAELRSQLDSPALGNYLASFRFESQEEAFNRLAESADVDGGIDYITPDQLNASFWLQLSNPEDSALIVEALTKQPGVADVRDQRGFFDPIIAVLNNATLVSATIASIMLLSAALLTTTTIRLSAFSRRREISIKRLVGASRLSIQLPFVIEGILATLIGAGLAIAVMNYVVNNLEAAKLESQLSIGNLVSNSDVAALSPWLLQIAVVLATVAATVSTSRHIRS